MYRPAMADAKLLMKTISAAYAAIPKIMRRFGERGS